jgi:hypothetical protein
LVSIDTKRQTAAKHAVVMQVDIIIEQLERVTRADIPVARRRAIVSALYATIADELAGAGAIPDYDALLRDVLAEREAFVAATTDEPAWQEASRGEDSIVRLRRRFESYRRLVSPELPTWGWPAREERVMVAS